MAYATNDLTVMSSGFLESSQSIWLYRNTAGDSAAVIKGNAYFSDGLLKGMKLGDVVFVFNVGNTAADTNIYAVSNVTTEAVTVAAGVSIT